MNVDGCFETRCRQLLEPQRFVSYFPIVVIPEPEAEFSALCRDPLIEAMPSAIDVGLADRNSSIPLGLLSVGPVQSSTIGVECKYSGRVRVQSCVQRRPAGYTGCGGTKRLGEDSAFSGQLVQDPFRTYATVKNLVYKPAIRIIRRMSLDPSAHSRDPLRFDRIRFAGLVFHQKVFR